MTAGNDGVGSLFHRQQLAVEAMREQHRAQMRFSQPDLGHRQAADHAALHDQDLTLAGHRLINLRHEFSEARRDSDGETFHGIARFRAVTEVESA